MSLYYCHHCHSTTWCQIQGICPRCSHFCSKVEDGVNREEIITREEGKVVMGQGIIDTAKELHDNTFKVMNTNLRLLHFRIEQLVIANCLPYFEATVHPRSYEDDSTYGIVMGLRTTVKDAINHIPSAFSILKRDYQKVQPEYRIHTTLHNSATFSIFIGASFYNIINDNNKQEIQLYDYFNYPLAEGIIAETDNIRLFDNIADIDSILKHFRDKVFNTLYIAEWGK